MTSSDRISDIIAQARAAERMRIADYIVRRARAHKREGEFLCAQLLLELASAVRKPLRRAQARGRR